MEDSLKALVPILIAYSVRIVGALIALWISFRVSSWVQGRLTRTLRRRKFDETLAIFFGNIVKWTVLTAAILACLSVFGIETTSFAAILGAAGLAIGLAFQGTLSNFAAGVMLLVFRPFKVGDFVVISGQSGTVIEIGLFSCSLDTLDNRRIIVPNTSVGSAVIENVTFNDKRRVDIDVAITGEVEIDRAMDLLNQAAAVVPGRDAESGHQVFLRGFAADTIQWQVRVWCATPAYGDVWHATILAIKRELEKGQVPGPKTHVAIQGSLSR